MNKFIAVALFAFVVSAIAGPVPNEIDDDATELALFETDQKETSGLSGDKLIFSDFCLQSRDFLKSSLNDAVNTGTAHVFRMIVDTINEVTTSMGEAERIAVEQGSEAIGKDAKQFKDAAVNVVKNMSASGKDRIGQIMDRFKEQLTREKLQEKAEEACSFVVQMLKPELDKNLNMFKKEVLATSDGQKYADMLKNTKIENVGCVTTSRVSKIAKACNIIQLVGPQAIEFMG